MLILMMISYERDIQFYSRIENYIDADAVLRAKRTRNASEIDWRYRLDFLPNLVWDLYPFT